MEHLDDTESEKRIMYIKSSNSPKVVEIINSHFLWKLSTIKSWNSILPFEGHEDGGLLYSIIFGGSCGICMNCLIL